MKKAFKDLTLLRKVLYVLVEVVILIIAFFVLYFLTYLTQYLASNVQSGSLLLTLVYILAIPLLLIVVIYLFNIFGYNYARNSKTGKTFLKIVICLLILIFIVDLISDIVQLRFHLMLTSLPVEQQREILGDIAWAEYYNKVFSGQIITLGKIIIYFIWQLVGIISFAKGALGYYGETEN